MNNWEKPIYLASPYTHPDEPVMEGRYREIVRIAAELFKDGKVFFCPIAQSHVLKEIAGLQGSWKEFSKFDCAFIRNSSEVLVATMDGWLESVGVQAEIQFAKKVGIPVRYLDPETLSITKYPKTQELQNGN